VNEAFTAVPATMSALSALSATHHAVGAAHTTAGSADHAAHAAAAVAALGPIGVSSGLTPAYVQAQGNCLNSASQVGNVFHALGGATDACTAATVAFDNA
jgi:hypothetical protein